MDKGGKGEERGCPRPMRGFKSISKPAQAHYLWSHWSLYRWHFCSQHRLVVLSTSCQLQA